MKTRIGCRIVAMVTAGLFATPCGAWGDVLPEGAPDQRAEMEVLKNPLPKGWTHGLVWAQALTWKSGHDVLRDGPARIVIDWMRMVERCGMLSRVVAQEDYGGQHGGTLSPDEGGLYLRNPWYGGDIHGPLWNSWVDNGVLEIDVGAVPDRVAHWWTRRVPVSPDCVYYGEARVKIEGEAAFMLGSDWWRSADAPPAGYDPACRTSNNCEAWLSAYYGSTGGQFVVVKAPAALLPPPPSEEVQKLMRLWFFAEDYLQDYADVAALWPGEPLEHFVLWGAEEGRRPGGYFDPVYYRSHYKDLAALLPLDLWMHYILFGSREGRYPAKKFEDFDGCAYFAAYPDLRAAGLDVEDALAHWILFGKDEGRIYFTK